MPPISTQATRGLAELQSPFDSICKDLLETADTLFQSLRPYMREPWGTRQLTIEFVDSPELNAFATVANDSFQIGINRGAVEHIYGATYGLMSCPTFLPEIGNAKAEVAPTSFPESGFCPIPISLAAPLYSGGDAAIPRDPLRQNVAMLLASIALEFLVFHEVGHIVAGHLEIEPTASIREYESGEDSSDAHALDRVLECDADAFACHSTGSIITHTKMASAIRDIVKVTHWTAAHAANVIYLVAITVLFRILYPRAPAKIGPQTQKHPHPAIRAAIVSVCTVSRSMHNNQFTPPELQTVFNSSVRNVEEVWAEYRLPGQVLQSEKLWAESVRNGLLELLDCYEASTEILDRRSHLDRRWHDWKWPPAMEPTCSSTKA